MSERNIINEYFQGVKLQNIGRISTNFSEGKQESTTAYFSRISSKNNRFVALIAISNENTSKEVELSELKWIQIDYRTYLDEETFDNIIPLPENYNIYSIKPSSVSSENDQYITKTRSQYTNDRNVYQAGNANIALISLTPIKDDDIVDFPDKVSLIAALNHANTSIRI